MSPDYKHIGRRIKEVRVLRGISQAELAELIDMSAAYISHMETAKKHVCIF